MPLERAELTESSPAFEQQVDRIVRSDVFRNADALRKLLRFLADRLASGEAEQLKEYSVGVDALGKPTDYDPRQDSTVRIQVGRLRLKLAEYYMSEGLQDPCIIELPKGHFKLKVTLRQPVASTAPAPLTPPEPLKTSRTLAYVLGATALLTTAWAVVTTIQLNSERQKTAVWQSGWTPALEQLWSPFVSSNRPVLVAIEDPPFVQFTGYGAYREINLNSWEDIEKSPNVAKIRQLLGNPEMRPSYYYAPIGEVGAAFYLGRFLGPRVPSISLSGARDLSWQQLANHNVLYVGASIFFIQRFTGLPVEVDFNHSSTGVTNASPGEGELAFYPEQGQGDVSTNGERYALVTHLPGPSGTGEITGFTSMRTTSRQGAVQWFMDPGNAKLLVDRMKKPDGSLPQYYQVLLKIKFKDNVPIETSYVLHHELTARASK